MPFFFSSAEHNLIIMLCFGVSLFVIIFIYIVGKTGGIKQKLDHRDRLKKELAIAKSLAELADLRFRRPYQSAEVYRKHKDNLKKRRARVHRLTEELNAAEKELGTVQ